MAAKRTMASTSLSLCVEDITSSLDVLKQTTEKLGKLTSKSERLAKVLSFSTGKHLVRQS
jgi:hypothetical protein